MTTQAQSDLFHVVDLDADRRELRRFTVDKTKSPGGLWPLYGKPAEARARYIWNASRGPEIPKPKTLRQLLTMTPRKRPAGLRVDGGHPPRKLTDSQNSRFGSVRGLLSDAIDHIRHRLETETGPVIVHLFDPEPHIREDWRKVDVNRELRIAFIHQDRVQFCYVDPADWALS